MPHPIFKLPDGSIRALGRDTQATMAAWSHIIASVPVAPRIFSGAAPRKSPDIRRYYHASFLSQRQRGYCFPAGTLILLEDGTEKPIEEIVIGDRVITHLGRSRSVVNTFERTYSGTMTTITVKGWQYPLTMTENHKIFVVKNAEVGSRTKHGHYRPGEVVKLEANQLRPKDYIIMSRGVPSGMEDLRIDVCEYVKDCITVGDRCKRPGGFSKHEIKWDIALDEKFAKFIGLYLAEGGSGDTWCRKNPANFKLSFNSNERTLMEFAVAAIRDIFGLESKIVDLGSGGNRSQVVCHSTLLGMFFKEFCGKHIYEKSVPPVFFLARPSIKRELIRGWLEGDGHSRPVGIDGQGLRRSIELSGVTVSKKLHRSLFRLAMSIGAKGSARVGKPKNRRYERRDLCFYSQDAIAIYPELRDQTEEAGIPLDGARNHHAHELGYLCKIDKITLTDVEEIPVYNFEVEEDHSYIANGIAGLNCVGFNTCGTFMTLLRIPPGATGTTGEPLPLTQLSPLYTYDIARWQCEKDGYNMGTQDGLIGSEAFIAAKNAGCVELPLYPSGPSDIDNHKNGTKPKPPVLEHGQEHILKDFAIAESFEHGLELMGGGFPTVFCSEIPSGMMQTDAKGFFRMKGSVVGGHAYTIIDYDKDQNLAWVCQSWERWGEKTSDPAFADMHGFTQMGTCPLDELAQWFSANAMAKGASEIMVANMIEGFAPLIVDYSSM